MSAGVIALSCVSITGVATAKRRRLGQLARPGPLPPRELARYAGGCHECRPPQFGNGRRHPHRGVHQCSSCRLDHVGPQSLAAPDGRGSEWCHRERRVSTIHAAHFKCFDVNHNGKLEGPELRALGNCGWEQTCGSRRGQTRHPAEQHAVNNKATKLGLSNSSLEQMAYVGRRRTPMRRGFARGRPLEASFDGFAGAHALPALGETGPRGRLLRRSRAQPFPQQDAHVRDRSRQRIQECG